MQHSDLPVIQICGVTVNFSRVLLLPSVNLSFLFLVLCGACFYSFVCDLSVYLPFYPKALKVLSVTIYCIVLLDILLYINVSNDKYYAIQTLLSSVSVSVLIILCITHLPPILPVSVFCCCSLFLFRVNRLLSLLSVRAEVMKDKSVFVRFCMTDFQFPS